MRAILLSLNTIILLVGIVGAIAFLINSSFEIVTAIINFWVLFTGILGVFGAKRYSYCLLTLYLAFIGVLFIASLFTVGCAYIDMSLLTSNLNVDFAKDWIENNEDIYRFALVGWAGMELVCILVGISYRRALSDRLIDKNGRSRLDDEEIALVNYESML